MFLKDTPTIVTSQTLFDRLLGNYILNELLGETNMSAVYRGKKRGTAEYVAIKILLPEAFDILVWTN